MWLFFTLFSTAAWSFAELFYKKGARPEERYAHLKTGICVGIVMGAHALFTLLTQDVNYDPMNILHYFPVSFLYGLAMVLSYFGMRFVEESISDPIENTCGSICTLLCVIFLHEHVSTIAAISILCTLVGIIGLGILDNTGETDRKKKLGKKLAIIAFCMPISYAILDAIAELLDIIQLDLESTSLTNVTADNLELVANTSYELTWFIASLLMIAFLIIKKEKFGSVSYQKDKIFAACCETAGQMTYVFAMSGNGAIAAPIISSYCVFSVLLSRIFLKEKLTKRQYLFVFITIVGILILGVAEA